MKIESITFTPSRGCLVQFTGWHGLADIESKPLFLVSGCCMIHPLDERDREAAEDLLTMPIESGRAYGHRDPVLAELAARYLLWLDGGPAEDESQNPLPLDEARLTLSRFLETHLPL